MLELVLSAALTVSFEGRLAPKSPPGRSSAGARISRTTEDLRRVSDRTTVLDRGASDAGMQIAANPSPSPAPIRPHHNIGAARPAVLRNSANGAIQPVNHSKSSSIKQTDKAPQGAGKSQ